MSGQTIADGPVHLLNEQFSNEQRSEAHAIGDISNQ